MTDEPLPSDLARKFGHLRFIHKTGRDEWASECPRCLDSGHYGRDLPDRFRMFPAEPGKSARGWCRSCHYFEWADVDSESGRPSKEAIEAATKERLRLTELENQRIKEKVKAIADSNFWRKWHETMTPEQRRLWEREGIPSFFIDYYSLGFVADHTYCYGGSQWHSPALTIPHYDQGWQLSNIQYRLLDPTSGAGKYRQTAGLPAAMFLTEPDEPLDRGILIVEGAKKAMVSYAYLGGKDFSIVAVPSKNPTDEMIGRMSDCEPIYICLDPDAYVPTKTRDGNILPPAVNRVVKQVGRERARLVKLPCKPDDLFTTYAGTADDMRNFIGMATRA